MTDREIREALGLASCRPSNITAGRARRVQKRLAEEAALARLCAVCGLREHGRLSPACDQDACRLILSRIDDRAGTRSKPVFPLLRNAVLDAQDLEFRCEAADPTRRPLRWIKVTVSVEDIP